MCVFVRAHAGCACVHVYAHGKEQSKELCGGEIVQKGAREETEWQAAERAACGGGRGADAGA